MPRPPLPLSQPGVEKKRGHHFQIGKHKQSVVSSLIVLFYTRVTSPFLSHSSDRQTPAVLVHSLNHDEARCLRSWLVKIPTAQREREDCAKLGPLHSSIPAFEKQMKTEQRKENNNNNINYNNNNNNNNNPSFRTARQWEMEPSASTMKHRWMAEHVKWTSKQTNEADEVEQVRGTRLVSHPHRRVEEARCEVTTKKQNKKNGCQS